LRTEHLTQPDIVVAAFAATVASTVAILRVLNEQIAVMHQQVQAQFAQHPAAKIVESQPGLGPILGARVLGEFGDAKDRYTSARARKNYAGTSPITRASGRRKVVLARFVHNDRLLDALDSQAYAALKVSPGARGYYGRLRDRGASHSAALRQLANRLVGILHGCLKTETRYDEATAWSHHAPAVSVSTPAGLASKRALLIVGVEVVRSCFAAGVPGLEFRLGSFARWRGKSSEALPGMVTA
jgi:Transposase IS116/IS110/IS902 family